MRLGRRRSEMKENTLDSPDSCQIWPELFVTSTGQSDTTHTVAPWAWHLLSPTLIDWEKVHSYRYTES